MDEHDSVWRSALSIGIVCGMSSTASDVWSLALLDLRLVEDHVLPHDRVVLLA